MDGAPIAGTECSPLLDDIAIAAREARRRYAERYARRPEVLVLAGPQVWQEIAVVVARDGRLFWRLDPMKNEVVGVDGTRIVRAEIGKDEWLVALLTDRRGSI